MLVSDLLSASTTHELLYRLFTSETGLASVSHPCVQHQAVVDAMKPLRENILANLDDTVLLHFYADHTLIGELNVSIKADAQLFMDVYKDFNRYPQAAVLTRHIYPLAGLMISRNAEMKRFVLRQLEHHISQYPDAVGHRIFDTLLMFELSELIPPLKAVLKARGEAASTATPPA